MREQDGIGRYAQTGECRDLLHCTPTVFAVRQDGRTSHPLCVRRGLEHTLVTRVEFSPVRRNFNNSGAMLSSLQDRRGVVEFINADDEIINEQLSELVNTDAGSPVTRTVVPLVV